MNTKNLLLLCIASTSIFAMKNEENSLTQHSKNYDNKDLFYTPYITTVHQKNPITQNERSLFKQLINQFKNPDYNESINFLNNKHDELSALAHKYKIQNLYLTLFTRAVPINELQNIIIKNYHSLITYTNNQEKALNHLKQSLLNSKISIKTIKRIPPAMDGYYVPYLHQYSYDKKYGFHKSSDRCILVYDTQTNTDIIPTEHILAACFLHKKNSFVYINKNEQLVQYDIEKNKETIIASTLHDKKKNSYFWKITTKPNGSIFIAPHHKKTGLYTQLILASLDGTLKTIINTPFTAITFNKDRSLVVTSNDAEITLYSFDGKNLKPLADKNTKIYNSGARYTTLHFNNECNSFIATTDKDTLFNNATLFRIIRKKENGYHLKGIITSGNTLDHNILYHSKHNCSSTLIECNDKPVKTFDHKGVTTSYTEHPKEIHASALSKNGQFLASINKPDHRDKKQTLTIQNLFNNQISSTEVAIDLIGHPLEKLHFHPNNTLLIGDSFMETTIYTLQNNALVTIVTAPYCDSYFNRDETILCNSENHHKLYSPEDLKTLDTIIPNHSINLLQYFALKNIDDKKRDSNGTYSVPQTLFNKLCWESFKPEQVTSLSETLSLSLDMSSLNNAH
jgi:hypothetical protein